MPGDEVVVRVVVLDDPEGAEVGHVGFHRRLLHVTSVTDKNNKKLSGKIFSTPKYLRSLLGDTPSPVRSGIGMTITVMTTAFEL